MIPRERTFSCRFLDACGTRQQADCRCCRRFLFLAARPFLCALWLAATLPALGASHASIDQLSSLLQSTRSDSKLAWRLSQMQLAARLPGDTLAGLLQRCPGPESKWALLSLADSSEFLPLAAPTPTPPPPDPAAAHDLLQRAADSAQAAFARLPNLFATRKVLAFADVPANSRGNGNRSLPLTYLGPDSSTVLYRNGKEVIDSGHAPATKPDTTSPDAGLVTSGEFGATLRLVFSDAAQGKLAFARGEQIGSRTAAVFRFSVPRAQSHYELKYCCMPAGSKRFFDAFTPYHGEITIDAESAQVLRLTLIAEVPHNAPLTRADVLVEYGAVALGGHSYLCPLHSVTIVAAFQPGVGGGDSGPIDSNVSDNHVQGMSLGLKSTEYGPLQTMLNDITFQDYHLFRGDTRVLPSAEDLPSDPHP